MPTAASAAPGNFRCASAALADVQHRLLLHEESFATASATIAARTCGRRSPTVDTTRGTWVEAPFVRVYDGRYGTWVRAPFVNLWSPH